MSDILLPADGGVFSLRVAAVWNRNGRVLVQRTADACAYALPGGHVEFGEDTKEALLRELEEELGVKAEIQRLLWVEEGFWNNRGKQCHQICFYYLISAKGEGLPEQGAFYRQDQPGRGRDVEFLFLPVEELKSLPLYPAFAKKELEQLTGPVKHFVERVEEI